MDKTAKVLLLFACIGALTSAIVPSLVTSVNWWQEKKGLRPVLILSWIAVGVVSLALADSVRKWLKVSA